MRLRVTASLAAALICLIPVAGSALTPYGQDFESYSLPSPGGLLGDSWVVYGNVFGYDWAWWYGYGSFPAPNDGAAFCAIVPGEGLGNQCLAVYSDYNNGNQADGIIEANVYHEQTVMAGDVGQTWTFSFQAKHGNLAGSSTAFAFIKTLNPAAGWATTNNIRTETTAIPAIWAPYQVQIGITPDLVGQIMQFGFVSYCRLYEPSGIFYDDVSFSSGAPVATESSTWGGVKDLYR
jgi:hypothetical protein